jgi:hypothetical protein
LARVFVRGLAEVGAPDFLVLFSSNGFVPGSTSYTIFGLGGVEHQRDQLTVVARAPNWRSLVNEFVKGTTESICLPELKGLTDEAKS